MIICDNVVDFNLMRHAMLLRKARRLLSHPGFKEIHKSSVLRAVVGATYNLNGSYKIIKNVECLTYF